MSFEQKREAMKDLPVWISIENFFQDENHPGIDFFRIKYGAQTVFIGSDGSVEAAGKLSDAEKALIATRWQEFQRSRNGKTAIAAVKRKK